MERVHFSAIEKKWQKIFDKTKLVTGNKKNFIVLKCFRTHLEEFTWGMFEITR